MLAVALAFLLFIAGSTSLARSQAMRDSVKARAQLADSSGKLAAAAAPGALSTQVGDELLLLGEDGLQAEAQLRSRSPFRAANSSSSGDTTAALLALAGADPPPPPAGPVRMAGEGLEAYAEAAVKVALNRTTAYVPVGFSMREFAVNWLLRAEAVGLRGVVIGALDLAIADFLMQDSRVVRLCACVSVWQPLFCDDHASIRGDYCVHSFYTEKNCHNRFPTKQANISFGVITWPSSDMPLHDYGTKCAQRRRKPGMQTYHAV